MITCTDTQIQSQDGWSFHLPNDKSNIGGSMPTRYGYCQGIPGKPTATLFFVTGPGWGTVEHYITRPVLPNSGSLEMSFDLTVGPDTLSMAALIETDVILTIGGLTSNLSLQLLKGNLGWSVQPVNATGNWIDSGMLVPLKEGTHPVKIRYAFGSGVSQVVSYAFDDIQTAAAIGPKIPTEKRGWSDGAIIQIQQTLNKDGGSYGILIDNLCLEWS